MLYHWRNTSKGYPAPREELSAYAPKAETMKIDVDKIREVIGQGGKVIQKIVAETGAKIDIEEDGTIHIFAVDQESGKAAKDAIKQLKPHEILLLENVRKFFIEEASYLVK